MYAWIFKPSVRLSRQIQRALISHSPRHVLSLVVVVVIVVVVGVVQQHTCLHLTLVGGSDGAKGKV